MEQLTGTDRRGRAMRNHTRQETSSSFPATSKFRKNNSKAPLHEFGLSDLYFNIEITSQVAVSTSEYDHDLMTRQKDISANLPPPR
ncbi:hypothetical protein TSAR_015859 [Trichomalopsis sarcophagae]|uniref:Uncharacterized protein n=1 Tax=Trichomalopsis sarcophagae TaxID=543379 RepID=A0A232EJH8_9HYME|nr:hypothetical protein TSAR_015859 [Trichomalopsis sarcophagae]